jgi:hypothetical protein
MAFKTAGANASGGSKIRVDLFLRLPRPALARPVRMYLRQDVHAGSAGRLNRLFVHGTRTLLVSSENQDGLE